MPLFLCLLARGLAASLAASPSQGAVAIAAIRPPMAPENPLDDRPDDASRLFTAVPRAIPAPCRNASVVSSSSLASRSSPGSDARRLASPKSRIFAWPDGLTTDVLSVGRARLLGLPIAELALRAERIAKPLKSRKSPTSSWYWPPIYAIRVDAGKTLLLHRRVRGECRRDESPGRHARLRRRDHEQRHRLHLRPRRALHRRADEQRRRWPSPAATPTSTAT